MMYNLKQVQEFYDLATLECNENKAWLFESHFAKVVTEHCAKIVEECSILRIPLSNVADIVRSGQRPIQEFFHE